MFSRKYLIVLIYFCLSLCSDENKTKLLFGEKVKLN